MYLIWLALILVVLVLGVHIATLLQLAKLRRAGLYPEAGQATMADVESLLRSGLSVWAIRCYREVHGCSLRRAKEAVANLSASS
jgi:hypothetical protein